MQFLKSIFIFIIHSNLLISFCAVAFFLTGAQLTGLERVEIGRAIVIFSATFLTYNLTIFLSSFNRQGKKAQGKMSWYLRHKWVLYVMLLASLLLLLIFFPYENPEECLFFIHLGFISILYNVPDRLFNTSYRSIRSIPLIKIFLIAYVWAALGAWYPAILQPAPSGFPFLLFFLFFLFILAITLPFDIRDYYSDQKTELLTIPGLIGIRSTKLVAVGLMLIYGGVLGAFIMPWTSVVLLVLIPSFLIWFSSNQRQDWYYTGLVDGLIILQYFLVCLFIGGTKLG